MNPRQDHAGLFERNPALNGNLPEVLIQRQHDAGLGFGEVQKDSVLPCGAIGSGPEQLKSDKPCIRGPSTWEWLPTLDTFRTFAA